jgi:hypothetical protein
LGKIEMKINDEGRISSYVATNPILLDSSVTKSMLSPVLFILL